MLKPTSNREEVAEEQLSSAARVLVVNDEPIIASTLATILKVHGFDARFFVNPIEALEVSRASRLDLLISDVIMPSLPGPELAIKVKAIYPNCNVLLLSEQTANNELLKKPRRDVFNFQFVDKPVHPPTLLAKIRAMKLDGFVEGEPGNATPPSAVRPTLREITDADLLRFRRANGFWT